jgi:ribosomal protein S2
LLLARTSDDNLLGETVNTNQEVGLEASTKAAKYMFVSRHQITAQNSYMKAASKCSENVPVFKRIGTMLTNQSSIQEETERLDLGNACYHSVQNLLSSCLLSQKGNIKMYKTIILPFV